MDEKLKAIFARPRISDIKEDRELVVASHNLIDSITSLNANQYCLIRSTLLPLIAGTNMVFEEASKKFLKHGADVKVGRQDSLELALAKKETPREQRQQAFDELSQSRETRFAGYTLKPIFTPDHRTRRFSLTNIMEGTLLYWATTVGYFSPMKVAAYEDARIVGREGAQVVVSGIPSRTAIKNGTYLSAETNHEITLNNVPVKDTAYKYVLGASVHSDHVCKSKRYGVLRYNHDHDNQNSRIVTFCPHDVAAYFAVAAHFAKKGNTIPAKFSPILVPSEDMLGFYRKLENQVLIQSRDDEIAGIKNRVLTDGEKEILLWGLIRVKGHNANCISTKPVASYKYM